MSFCRWFNLVWEFGCWSPKVLVLVDRVMVISLEEKVFGFILGSVLGLELRLNHRSKYSLGKHCILE